MGHQIFSVGCLLAGVLYTAMVIGLVYCVPVVAGINREDIRSVIQLSVKKIWNK